MERELLTEQTIAHDVMCDNEIWISHIFANEVKCYSVVLSNNLTMCHKGLLTGKLIMSENVVLPDKYGLPGYCTDIGLQHEQLVTCNLFLLCDGHKRVSDSLAATIVK